VVPLDRSGVVAPPEWKKRVRRRLKDARAFSRKAKAFEKIPLNLAKRRDGFCAYAGHVFKKGEFPEVWKCEELRTALRRMTGGYCSYCQASVEDGSFAAVEHFQPKSLFPTLAYDVGNYLYSCPRCNHHKGDKWPASGAYVRPDLGNLTGRFRFKRTGWVKVVRGDSDALATVRDFSLNRKGLRKKRRAAIKEQLNALEPILKMPGLTDDQRLRLARPHVKKRLARFSEAINQNVRRAWKRWFPGVPL
jgi:uncharacterized protein (TIGR02646 family)